MKAWHTFRDQHQKINNGNDDFNQQHHLSNTSLNKLMRNIETLTQSMSVANKMNLVHK